MPVQYVSNMKNMYIAILITLIGTFTVLCMQNAYAIPYVSSQDLYKQSDMVFYGTVISKSAGPGPDYNYYQVKVDTYFKNPQNSDSITIAGRKSDDTKVQYPQFDAGDSAIFYVNKLDGINTLSLYSQKADSACSIASFGSYDVSNDTNIMRGAPVHKIRILDSAGNIVNVAKTDQPLVITSYDFSNVMPQARNITATLVIQKYNDTQPVFYQEQNVPMIACSYNPKPSWNFTPLASGHYNATLTFDDMKIATDFDVRDNLSSKSIDKAPNELSPLKQFESGVAALDVKCKENFMLVTKASDGSPACVTPLTYNKLALQGWAKLQGVTTTTFVEVNGTKYDIPYIVRGWTNKLLYITANTTQNSLSVFVESTAQKGEVTLTIPRALLDSKSVYGNQDTSFVVLVDKTEVKYTETASIDARTLTIPFEFGAKKIEIIATQNM